MEFNFTGNFQYDFGLVGYVKVLEFFGMPFKIKGNVLLVDDIVWADSFNLFYPLFPRKTSAFRQGIQRRLP